MTSVKKDLKNNNFIGKVVVNEDPDMVGRCKVRVLGLMDELEDNLLPWFSPMNISTFSSDAGGGNFSVPKKGSWVRVRFAGGDIYSGEYTSLQNIDPGIFQGNPSLDKDDYLGTHVLLYDRDQELMIVFQPHSGFTIFYRESKINIAASNAITISQPNNNSIITLNNDTINITSKSEINVTGKSAVNVTGNVINLNGSSVNAGKSPNYSAVKGETLVSVLETICKAIWDKYPISPGMPNTSMIPSILSSSVKLQG